MKEKEIKQTLAELPDIRAPLPLALEDPAFLRICHEAIATRELVAQFNRLTGSTLGARLSPIEAMVDAATGKADTDIRAFINFCHEYIYLRLPSDALHALRLAEEASHAEVSKSAGA